MSRKPKKKIIIIKQVTIIIFKNNFYSNNFIEYEGNADRNKTLPIKKNTLMKLNHA